MARHAPRRKQHHIDSDRIVRPGKARAEHFRRRRDAAQPIFADRMGEFGGADAPLDPYKGEGESAPRAQIDSARQHQQPSSPASLGQALRRERGWKYGVTS